MELAFGTLVKINAPSDNIKGLTGLVLAHDLKTNKVTYRIVTDNYMGSASYTTDRWNCTVVGKYDGYIKL